MTARSESRFYYFDYFRAVAIVMVVAGHCFMNRTPQSVAEGVIFNAISGGSALFVFISGFFFREVFYRKFDYRKFLSKKSEGVLTPYIVLSTAWVVLNVLTARQFFGPSASLGYPQLFFTLNFILDLLLGRAIFSYWSIPFVMIIFLMSPIFLRFIELPSRTKVAITVLLFAVSMYVQRPAYNLNPAHSVTYFVPYYLFGILYAEHRSAIDCALKRSLAVILCATVTVTIAMTMAGQLGNAHKSDTLLWTGLDYMVLQKITMILCLLAVLRRLNDRDLPGLKLVAEASFAIYFIHPWILLPLQSQYFGLVANRPADVVLQFVLVSAASLLVALACRKILQEKSRMVIGW